MYIHSEVVALTHMQVGIQQKDPALFDFDK